MFTVDVKQQHNNNNNNIMFGEHNGCRGYLNRLDDELAYQRRGLCEYGSANITNGGSGGIISTAVLELPHQRVSKAKFGDGTSRRRL